MTSAEIYSMVCDMLLDYMKSHNPFSCDLVATNMYVYAACAFYPQADEWYLAHMGHRPNPIHCTV